MKKSIVLGVFSAKGGVGKSLIASNLGAAFAAGNQLPTLLIDLVAGSGSADLLLDLEPERSWVDLLPVIDELTTQHISLAITSHMSNLHLLACPEDPMQGELLSNQNLDTLLSFLRNEYAIVVLDLPAGMDEPVLAAYDLVDLCLVVLTPDAPTIRATKRLFDSLPSSDRHIGLVVNQYGRGAPVKPKEIENHLEAQAQICAVLPVDPAAVWVNISFGQPCVLRRKRGLGRAIRGMANTVLKVAKKGP